MALVSTFQQPTVLLLVAVWTYLGVANVQADSKKCRVLDLCARQHAAVPLAKGDMCLAAGHSLQQDGSSRLC